ncbi:MAG: Gfo/Idh/MocA family oxidoreductase, partial [Planctomycetota bacterium]
MKATFHRRRFLHSTAAAAAGAIVAPCVVPCSVLGKQGAVPPGERITLAFLGPGNRGRGLMKVFVPRPEVETVAISDVIAAQRGRAMAALAQLTDQSKPGRRRACKTYIDFRGVLDRDDVDAVVVSAPEHWRAIMCIMAAKAGKDIYTEKPFSLTVKEGKAMVDA